MEEWRQIEGAPGYEISSLGRVRSSRPTNQWSAKSHPVVLRTFDDKNGYQMLSIYFGERKLRRQVYIATLVCEAWHGKRPSGMVVRHLNGNHNDNAPTNLAWGTQSQNAKDKENAGYISLAESRRQASDRG